MGNDSTRTQQGKHKAEMCSSSSGTFDGYERVRPMYEILMTADDFRWLMSLVEDGCSCFECDIFDKCQEENRDYCEKEQNENGKRID